MNSVLKVEGLHRWLGSGGNRQHVLKGLNFSLDAGKVYAVVGPSGCGKSTLLYLLGLLDHPDEGAILLNDQRIDSASDRDRTRLRGELLGICLPVPLFAQRVYGARKHHASNPEARTDGSRSCGQG